MRPGRARRCHGSAAHTHGLKPEWASRGGGGRRRLARGNGEPSGIPWGGAGRVGGRAELRGWCQWVGLWGGRSPLRCSKTVASGQSTQIREKQHGHLHNAGRCKRKEKKGGGKRNENLHPLLDAMNSTVCWAALKKGRPAGRGRGLSSSPQLL